MQATDDLADQGLLPLELFHLQIQLKIHAKEQPAFAFTSWRLFLDLVIINYELFVYLYYNEWETDQESTTLLEALWKMRLYAKILQQQAWIDQELY